MYVYCYNEVSKSINHYTLKTQCLTQLVYVVSCPSHGIINAQNKLARICPTCMDAFILYCSFITTTLTLIAARKWFSIWFNKLNQGIKKVSDLHTSRCVVTSVPSIYCCTMCVFDSNACVLDLCMMIHWMPIGTQTTLIHKKKQNVSKFNTIHTLVYTRIYIGCAILAHLFTSTCKAITQWRVLF